MSLSDSAYQGWCEGQYLSNAMMRALGALPVTLTPEGYLPLGSPSGATLVALERRQLARLVDGRWVRTVLGESVWARR